MQEEELLALNRRCVELADGLWQMPEYARYREMQSVDISIEIFHRNYVALNTALTVLALDQRVDHIFTTRNHDKLILAGKEVVFYLHNFVASAFSLRDHSRNVYEGRGRLKQLIQPFPGYKERVANDFVHDPLVHFVERLRVYCQHYSAPHVSIHMTYSDGRFVRNFQLPLDRLLAFSDWEKAKAYLTTLEGDVDIQQVATTYYEKVMAFHRWVQEQHEEVYAEDFKSFRDKEREVLLLQLESNIEHQLLALSKGNTIMKKLDVFTHVLSSGNFAQLEQPSLTLQEQARLAIALYEQKLEIPLPERIKEKIFHLYER